MDKPTVEEIITEVIQDICANYCKWPDLWDDSMEDCELSESSICRNCPLNKLG